MSVAGRLGWVQGGSRPLTMPSLLLFCCALGSVFLLLLVFSLALVSQSPRRRCGRAEGAHRPCCFQSWRAGAQLGRWETATPPMLHACRLWDRPHTLNGPAALSPLGRSRVAVCTPNHAGTVDLPGHPRLPTRFRANLGTNRASGAPC